MTINDMPGEPDDNNIQPAQDISEQVSKRHLPKDTFSRSLYIALVVLVILTLASLVLFIIPDDEPEKSSTTFPGSTTTLMTSSSISTTSTTTTTTTSTTRFDFIVVTGFPGEGRLFFLVEIDSFNSKNIEASYVNGNWIISRMQVCEDNSPKYRSTKIRYERQNESVRELVDVDDDFCTTGKITT